MVSARRIVAILIKDLRDATRDGRILLLLLAPIAGAVIFNATSRDPHERPTTHVAVFDANSRGVARELRTAAGHSVNVEVQDTRDRTSAHRLVAAKAVDFAVVVAPSERTGPARAEILVSEGASPTAQSVIALVPDALTRAAGRAPGAQTQVRVVAATHRKPGDLLESRELTVLLMIVLLLVFVAMTVVPIQIAEEIETGTLGALRLAAPGAEILAAKALAGFLYGLTGVALTLLLTHIHVHNPLLLFAAAFALTASLVAFGLMIGLLWPNSAAINTWSGFLTLPLFGLAAAALFADPGAFATILDLLPFPQAAKLLADGISPHTPYHAGLGSWAVIATWALLGYLILARIASRREI
jgi:ABC-type Na+ efflux pump permease subunit